VTDLRSVQTDRDLQTVWMSITAGLAVLAVALLLWAGAGSTLAIASPPSDPGTRVLSNGSVITIGVASSLSVLPEIGQRQANAVQLAVDQVNAAGGIDIGGTNYTLALVTVDSGCDPTQAAVAANTLLSAGAVAVVGHTCSGASLSAQPIYDAAGVAMISPSSSSLGLTEGGYNTTFRVYPRDDAPSVLLATHFRQSLRMDAVALVKGDGFEFSIDAFSDTFTGLGGTVTSRRTVDSTDEYTATLTAIQAENVDALFFCDSNASNAGLFSSVAHGLSLDTIGWDAEWSGEAALGDYTTAAGAGAEGDYVGLAGCRTDHMPGYDAFDAAYRAAWFPFYGDEAQYWGAYAYDAAKIIIAAIDRADSTDRAAIRDAIAATANYRGVVGTYEGFDGNGDVIPQWSWLEKYQNGQWTMGYPDRVFLPIIAQ